MKYIDVNRLEYMLYAASRDYPGKVALHAGNESVSYSDLNDRADRFAAALVDLGFRKGERFLIHLPNCVEVIVAMFGVLKAGGVFSVINPTTKRDKLAYIADDCGAVALLTQANAYDDAIYVRDSVSSLRDVIIFGGSKGPNGNGICDLESLLDRQPAGQDPSVQSMSGIDADLCMLVYTSGSTGRPKGVMMSHANVRFATASISTYLRNSHEEVIYCALPFSFDYGMYQIFLTLHEAATLVIDRGFTFPAASFAKMSEFGVTNFPLVPTMAALTVELGKVGPIESLRCVTNTGAALPPAHIETLTEIFPGLEIYSMYGLTECKRCTYIEPEEVRGRPDSVGKAIPYTETFVLNNDGTPAEAGQVGELVVRGRHVMAGYWNNEEATNEVLRPLPDAPWEKALFTGDLFRQDDEGYLYFVGRKDEMIKSRGEKVSPKEIENILYSIDGVTEACVVGIPDPVLGMSIKALIVAPDRELAEKDVVKILRSQLETNLVPQSIEFRESLAKTDSGKISRAEVTRLELAKGKVEAGVDG